MTRICGGLGDEPITSSPARKLLLPPSSSSLPSLDINYRSTTMADMNPADKNMGSRSRSPYHEHRRHTHHHHSRKTRSRSRSPHRESHEHHRHKHHRSRTPPPKAVALPYRAQKLSKHKYEEYKPLFQSYLDIQKNLDLDELDDREARGRWKSFVSRW